MSTKDFLEKDYYKALGVSKGATATRSRRRTASWPASTTPTPTRATRRPRSGSRRSPRRTTSCPTRSGARSTTRRGRCSAAAFRVPRARRRRRAASAASTSVTSSASTGQRRRRPGRPARRRVRPRRPDDHPGAAAARRGRRDRDIADVQRRDRRRDRVAAADRRGPLQGLPRHRRQGRHRAAGLPDLRGHRAVQPEPGQLRASPSRARPAGAAAWWSTTRARSARAAAGR